MQRPSVMSYCRLKECRMKESIWQNDYDHCDLISTDSYVFCVAFISLITYACQIQTIWEDFAPSWRDLCGGFNDAISTVWFSLGVGALSVIKTGYKKVFSWKYRTLVRQCSVAGLWLGIDMMMSYKQITRQYCKPTEDDEDNSTLCTHGR